MRLTLQFSANLVSAGEAEGLGIQMVTELGRVKASGLSGDNEPEISIDVIEEPARRPDGVRSILGMPVGPEQIFRRRLWLV